MNSKRIYILNGHPAKNSLNSALADAYLESARESGHEVRLTNLHELDFDPDFGFSGFSQHKPLEAGLEQVLSDIKWSEHMVLVTPLWWGGFPAKLKGVFDRAFLPGQAFDTRKLNWLGMPAPLLSGRTARVIITSDTPGWFMRWVYRNAVLWQIKAQILGFVGIKPVNITHLSGASHPKPGMVGKWINLIRGFGTAAA